MEYAQANDQTLDKATSCFISLLPHEIEFEGPVVYLEKPQTYPIGKGMLSMKSVQLSQRLIFKCKECVVLQLPVIISVQQKSV